MSQYITLLGTEDITRAAGTMRDAAERIERAAGSQSEDLTRHREFMNDWLYRFEAALTEHAKALSERIKP